MITKLCDEGLMVLLLSNTVPSQSDCFHMPSTSNVPMTHDDAIPSVEEKLKSRMMILVGPLQALADSSRCSHINVSATVFNAQVSGWL
jgi:hypothetical protein